MLYIRISKINKKINSKFTRGKTTNCKFLHQPPTRHTSARIFLPQFIKIRPSKNGGSSFGLRPR